MYSHRHNNKIIGGIPEESSLIWKSQYVQLIVRLLGFDIAIEVMEQTNHSSTKKATVPGDLSEEFAYDNSIKDLDMLIVVAGKKLLL